MAMDGETIFPAADVDKELNPGKNKEFVADPVSSDIAASKEIKEEEEAARKRRESERCETIQTLKTTILISAIVVAVAGAAFAIAKKLREK